MDRPEDALDSALTYIEDGRTYHLGRIDRTVGRGERYPEFGVARPKPAIIPRDMWREVDFSHFVPEILDQDAQGSCSAFASVQALHVCRAIAGAPYVRLSPGNLYGRINGGRDAGATLADAIAALEVVGVCRASIIGEYEWRQSRWPAGWKEDAKKFRVTEAWDCPTFEQISSAIQHGFATVVGVFVGRNFRVGSDGWVADYAGGGGGHALCGVGLKYHPTRRTWGVLVANSWGANWGMRGFAVIPENYFRYSPFADAWAVRVTVDPSGPE